MSSGIIGGTGPKSGVIGLPSTRFDEWIMTDNVSSTGLLGNGNVSNKTRHGLSVPVNSGVWTLPEDGMYRIEFMGNAIHNGNSRYPYVMIYIDAGADGSFVNEAQGMFQFASQGDNSYEQCSAHVSKNLSAGDKVKFEYAGSTVTWQGNATINFTYFRFTKLDVA